MTDAQKAGVHGTQDWQRLVQFLPVPAIVFQAKSFKPLFANRLAQQSLAVPLEAMGYMIESGMPADLLQQIEQCVWQGSDVVRDYPVRVESIYGNRNFVATCYSLTDKGKDGPWLYCGFDADLAKIRKVARKLAKDEVEERAVRVREAVKRQPTVAGLIEAAREEERLRIGIELHDHLGQELTVTQLALGRLSTEFEQWGLPDTPDGVHEQLTALREQVVRQVAALRRITFGLRPVSFGAKDMVTVVRELVQSFSAKAGVVGTVKVSEQWRAPPLNTAMNLFRCVEELLNNMAKHSQATSFHVEMDYDALNGMYHLEVHDDGIGLPEIAFSPDSSLLLSLKTRVMNMGGQVGGMSRPQIKGTRVKVIAPARRSQDKLL